MIVNTWGDLLDALLKIIFAPTEEQKSAAIYTLKNGQLPQFLAICEKQLGRVSGSKFIVGDDLTIADFVLACMTFNVLKNKMCALSYELGNVLNDYPKLNEYTGRLYTALQSHLDTRPKYIF